MDSPWAHPFFSSLLVFPGLSALQQLCGHLWVPQQLCSRQHRGCAWLPSKPSVVTFLWRWHSHRHPRVDQCPACDGRHKDRKAPLGVSQQLCAGDSPSLLTVCCMFCAACGFCLLSLGGSLLLNDFDDVPSGWWSDCFVERVQGRPGVSHCGGSSKPLWWASGLSPDLRCFQNSFLWG